MISWKERIIQTKEEDEKRELENGWLNPNNIDEYIKTTETVNEEKRLQQIYLDYRERLIGYFEYDLIMGFRDDFESVEDYIYYLDIH